MTEKVSRLRFTALIIFTSLLFIYKYGLAFPNEPDGFNNIKWGTHIGSLKEMISVERKGNGKDTSVFKRKNDIKSFGGAQIDSIEYEFFHDRFVSVTLKVKDLRNFIILKKFLFKKHGRPEEMVKGLERFFWDGDKTIITLISNQEIS
ncbi:MAG TPA: hypothetical protein PK864_10995 [Syntrophorhabdaceae bacterium]|nr:hypothetical protein [Syntrophorhabdaceae bacterium]HOT43207.1 hypothetical protein [Syntrophorhabdaceae bacterium]